MQINPKAIKELGVMLGQTHVAFGIMIEKVHALFGKKVAPDWNADDMKQLRADLMDAAIVAAGFKGTRSGKADNPDAKAYRTIHKRVSRLFQRVMALAYPAAEKASAPAKIVAKGWSTASTAKRLAFIKALLKAMLDDEKVTPSAEQHKQVVAILAAANK